ncbi:cadherin-20-like [Trichomycterus rosablanca]|uniref:cadherin-20-like n=1 Tax=Trichomycterus rosablanca TaxID=2290929 RepID=UPI002F353118
MARCAYFSMILAALTLVTPTIGGGVDEGTNVRPLRREKRGWVWNQFFVLEEYAEEKPLYVGKLHSDMDKGDGSVKYILSGEGAGSTFTLDDSTGDIHAIQRLDREVKAQYVLRAQATHRGTGLALEPESQFIVKIQDINDNEPRFLDGPYRATVPEMSPVGTLVIRVTATDADDPSYGNSARVQYSVVEGQPYFSVDSQTGDVRVSLADMDREVRAQYQVVIQAKDMGGQLGGLAGTTTIDITLSDVNDNPPRFTQKIYQMSVPESGPVGSVVGQVEVKDLDLGIYREMRYSIVDGDGRDVFEVSADSDHVYGVVTVKQHLDFETKRSYSLKIQGSNTHVDARFKASGPFSDVTVVHVNVEDVDEPPEFDATTFYAEVPEDAEIGTVIKVFSARDPDAADKSIRYAIEETSDPDKYFYLDVMRGSLMSVRPLDREKRDWHNLTVVAIETNNPAQASSVSVAIRVLDVNDNPPLLAQYYETFLCDSAKAGQLIQSIRAEDPDEPIGGQRFRYALAPEARNNPNFTIRDNQDNSAWILTRHDNWPSSSQRVYYLPISVSDGGEPVQSSTHTLTIRVCRCGGDGEVLTCEKAEPYTLPPNLSRTAFITILICTSSLIVMITLMLLLRGNTKKPFPNDEEENVHENIVRYDDEGGGEEDTEAFDITALWKTHAEPLSYAELAQSGPKLNLDAKPPLNNAKPRQERPEIKSLSRYVSQMDAKTHGADPNSANIYSYMLAKLCEADMHVEVAPHDSLRTFAYEGEGSVADSLSSLQSDDDNSHDYDYLDEWGPRFHKLAELYGTNQSYS